MNDYDMPTLRDAIAQVIDGLTDDAAKKLFLSQRGWQSCKCGCGYWTHPGKRWLGWFYLDTAYEAEKRGET
jgi:hypothetical protein